MLRSNSFSKSHCLDWAFAMNKKNTFYNGPSLIVIFLRVCINKSLAGSTPGLIFFGWRQNLGKLRLKRISEHFLPCISTRASTWRDRWPWGPCTWPCTRSSSGPTSSCPACNGIRGDGRAVRYPGKYFRLRLQQRRHLNTSLQKTDIS